MGTRIKNFEATGIAPNGRLFAGDLNLMQDTYADQSNFAQTIDLSVLRVGDSSLQLLKYGTGELRASSALRVDGILRGLSGLYAGAFTTTQRDAIASGFRPYGLVILNTTTNNYEWNQGSDATPNWVAMGMTTMAGLLGSRPAASIANVGLLYFATDDNGGTWYRSNGTTWVKASTGLSIITKGILSARPTAAAANTGNLYAATDDHGGTLHYSDGSTWSKIAASIFGEVQIGSVVDWPWGSALIGAQYLLPYGQAISRATYSELHTIASASSYPWGAGDGSTTFQLPDYRGRVGVGKDDMGGAAANRITAAISGIVGTTLGANGGAEGITLITAQIPSHTHQFNQSTFVGSFPQGASAVYQGGFTNVPTSATGGGGAHSNVQPSIIVNKMMRVL